MSRVLLYIYIYIENCHTVKTANSRHHGPRCQSQISLLMVHPTSQGYPLEYLAPLLQIPEVLLLDLVAEAVWLGLLAGMQEWGFWYRLWGWGWGSWPRNFMDFLLSGTRSLSHTRSFRSAVGRGSLTCLESALALAGAFHQRLGTSRHLCRMAGFLDIWK